VIRPSPAFARSGGGAGARRTTKQGDVVEIPLRQVHTASAGDEGATVLVFRVHEKGQPERHPVD